MTVNEKIQQLREQIANTPNKADKKAPFIELLAYYNYARSKNGYKIDYTDVKDIESKWKNEITQYGIFDKLYDNLTDEQIDKQNATIKSKIGDYLREIDTRASFYQFNHSDSAEITALKNNSAVLVGIVKTAQGNGSLADNKEFRDALLESYKAATEYKRAKRIEAKRDPDDESYEPGSPMGQARWRAADIIIDLAKKYIGDILVNHENYREEMNAAKETRPENTVAKNIFLFYRLKGR
ncbi:MAG: hypothetical protein IJM75_06760 [Ruminococcus sp.]|nr:hypothetical protein [Ruminococcus sp.]